MDICEAIKILSMCLLETDEVIRRKRYCTTLFNLFVNKEDVPVNFTSDESDAILGACDIVIACTEKEEVNPMTRLQTLFQQMNTLGSLNRAALMSGSDKLQAQKIYADLRTKETKTGCEAEDHCRAYCVTCLCKEKEARESAAVEQNVVDKPSPFIEGMRKALTEIGVNLDEAKAGDFIGDDYVKIVSQSAGERDGDGLPALVDQSEQAVLERAANAKRALKLAKKRASYILGVWRSPNAYSDMLVEVPDGVTELTRVDGQKLDLTYFYDGKEIYAEQGACRIADPILVEPEVGDLQIYFHLQRAKLNTNIFCVGRSKMHTAEWLNCQFEPTLSKIKRIVSKSDPTVTTRIAIAIDNGTLIDQLVTAIKCVYPKVQMFGVVAYLPTDSKAAKIQTAMLSTLKKSGIPRVAFEKISSSYIE